MRANLDFDISHLIIRAILSELLKFKVELPCFKMSKISIKRHIKLKFSLLVFILPKIMRLCTK